ncbi:MAG: tyrosine-type recombinase/integrase [Erysipelotrichaceae bacterium]|nr:tyrosine-type recombinase/integrase [Erysipelotrichaceae bacterium]
MIVLDGKNVYGIDQYLLKRKNGNNEVRYLVKYKNRIKRGFTSSIDAYFFLNDLKAGKVSMESRPDPDLRRSNESKKDWSIPEAVEKYLFIYKDQVRYGTYNKTCHYFRKVIIPNLPNVPVRSLTNLDILEFRSRLNSEIFKISDSSEDPETYATKSKNDILQQLKEFLFFAIENFGVKQGITKNVKYFKITHDEKLKKREKEENIWTVADYYSFLDALEKLYGKYSPTYGIFLVMGNKGLRLGECLALKFNDLRFENMLIVDESITRKTEDRKFEVGEPKNESSDRKIVIGKSLYDYLIGIREREKRHPDYGENWFIFHRPGNGLSPMAERTLNNHKQKALDLINLRWNTNHQLRHLYNTYLKDQGITVYDRSTTLGQKDAEINSSIYTHMSPEAMKKIADADEKLFNRKTL